MKEVIFTENFATKNKGEKFKCNSMLASRLVHIEKVAKYATDKAEVKKQVTKKDNKTSSKK